MYEHYKDPVISLARFLRRLLRGFAAILLVVALSLAMGVLGYHFTEDLPWLDALLNAAMILGGEGPVNVLYTNGGKLFASFYALYSGLFLIVVTGVMLAPVFHRVLHKFHYSAGKEEK